MRLIKDRERRNALFAQWFKATWQAVGPDSVERPGARQKLLDQVKRLADHVAPSSGAGARHGHR